MRIGIFGGSFNPIHKGHIAIAKTVLQSALVDQVWLMVSPRNPLKQQSDLINDNKRLELARKAVKGEKNIHACNFEFNLPKPSYTYITMQKLEETYPNTKFVLIIGADNWQAFHKWRNSDELKQKYDIIVYPRKDYVINQQDLPPNVTFLEMPLINISSTQIREMMKRGEDVSHLIP